MAAHGIFSQFRDAIKSIGLPDLSAIQKFPYVTDRLGRPVADFGINYKRVNGYYYDIEPTKPFLYVFFKKEIAENTQQIIAYEIDFTKKSIGHGGEGVVYPAKQYQVQNGELNYTGERFAIKLLWYRKDYDETSKSRLSNEKLYTPQTVMTEEPFTINKIHCFLYKFLPGKDCCNAELQIFPFTSILSLLSQLIGDVYLLHTGDFSSQSLKDMRLFSSAQRNGESSDAQSKSQRGRAHCDIKPENVLIGGSPDVPLCRLVDYSSACELDILIAHHTNYMYGIVSDKLPSAEEQDICGLGFTFLRIVTRGNNIASAYYAERRVGKVFNFTFGTFKKLCSYITDEIGSILADFINRILYDLCVQMCRLPNSQPIQYTAASVLEVIKAIENAYRYARSGCKEIAGYVERQIALAIIFCYLFSRKDDNPQQMDMITEILSEKSNYSIRVMQIFHGYLCRNITVNQMKEALERELLNAKNSNDSAGPSGSVNSLHR